jgi:hypothetical protein
MASSVMVAPGEYEKVGVNLPKEDMTSKQRFMMGFITCGGFIVGPTFFTIMPSLPIGLNDILFKSSFVVPHFRALCLLVMNIGLAPIMGIYLNSLSIMRMFAGWRLFYFTPMLVIIGLSKHPHISVSFIGMFLFTEGVMTLVGVLADKDDSFGATVKTFFGVFMPPHTSQGGGGARNLFAYLLALVGIIGSLLATIDCFFAIVFFTPENSSKVLAYAIFCLATPCFVILWVAHAGIGWTHWYGPLTCAGMQLVAGAWYLAGIPMNMAATLAVSWGVAGVAYALVNIWHSCAEAKEEAAKLEVAAIAKPNQE